MMLKSIYLNFRKLVFVLFDNIFNNILSIRKKPYISKVLEEVVFNGNSLILYRQSCKNIMKR